MGQRKTEEPRDFGFGSVVSGQTSERLLNRDGSFNVTRRGLGFGTSLSPYHSLLTMSWWRFLVLVILSYLLVNILFALGYMLCGPGAISGSLEGVGDGRFTTAFFFSVQTLCTIGYGHIHPVGLAANLLVSAQALAGLMGFALGTGLLFARFSRPTARIRFSRNAIMAPHQGGQAFMFRIANERKNQLIELEAQVVAGWIDRSTPVPVRRFAKLELERSKVAFFPLSWTIVHPIDEASPFWGKTQADLLANDTEILILLTGIDETFSQQVHTRSSYRADEILWGVKFQRIFDPTEPQGRMAIDLDRLDAVEPAA